MKKLVYSYIFTFSFCFMLLFYEPLLLYATNINDFWFDFAIMLKPVIILFLLTFIIGCLFFTIIYFINLKFQKDTKLYYIILIGFSICFFATYIQGNYLIGNLPSLDGSSINWNGYLKENIITLVVWLVLIVASILLVKKITLEKSVKITSYISIAICIMLAVSLVSTLITNNAFVKKGAHYTTDKNINNVSENKNFLIFMLDSISEDTFYKIWQNNEEYKDLFDDFTYYTDAMSTYPLTRNSVPFVLTGEWNRNETDFSTYSSNAYNNSPLFKLLEEKKYKINLYESDIVWNGNVDYNIDNLESCEDAKANFINFFKQEVKYALFKYLPYNLKRYSKIEGMSFSSSIIKFDSRNSVAYKNMTENGELSKVDSNIFQFYHIEGGHVPFKVDKNLNEIENGTYEQKVEACITLIRTYLIRLKENNAYDNSVIIIMADHGYDEVSLKRFNPLLMIKGINEKHDVIISDLPVSYVDLQDAYTSLLDNAQSTELFKHREQDKRRYFIFYKYLQENHMVEYTTTEAATDDSKFEQTGNIFDR